MKHWSVPFILFLAALLTLPARAQTIAAAYPGRGAFTTSGTWRFHTGDDRNWLSPNFDDSSWESIAADSPWGAQSHSAYTGFAWYRRSIQIDKVTGPISILVPPVDDAYELYWNGQLIGGFGQLPPHAVWHQSPISNVFELPGPDANGELKGVLAIRVWKAMLSTIDSAEEGGLTGPPQIGDSRALADSLKLHEASMENRNLLRMMQSAITFLIAVIALGMWAFDRSRRLHLWLRIFLLGFAGLALAVIPAFNRFDPYVWNQIYIAVLSAARDVGIWMLIMALFRLDRERAWRRATLVNTVVYLSVYGIDLFVAFNWASSWQPLRSIDAITTAIWSLLPAYLFVLLIAGLRRRPDRALLPTAFACAALELHLMLANAFGQYVRFTHFSYQSILDAAALHLGPYDISLGCQLQALVLVVLVVTIQREQIAERFRRLFAEAELKSAREIQRVLIPAEVPALPGFAVSSLYCPAGEVGGDLFQVIPGRDDDVLIILADVSGKGLRAAMAVSLLVGAARTLADTTKSPLAILGCLNQRLIDHADGSLCTCVALHVSASGLVTIANAGHLPPFMNGRMFALEGSFPLGVVAKPNFSVSYLQLQEGDDLTLYTDGVLEAQSRSGEIFGFDRTAQLLRSRPDVNAIAEAARSFGQQDDITVVKITRTFRSEPIINVSADLCSKSA